MALVLGLVACSASGGDDGIGGGDGAAQGNGAAQGSGADGSGATAAGGDGSGGDGSTPATCDPASRTIDGFDLDNSADPWYNYLEVNEDGKDHFLLETRPSASKALHVTAPAALTVVRDLADKDTCWSTADFGGIRFSASAAADTTVDVVIALKDNTPVDEGGACAGADCGDFHAARKVVIKPGWSTITLKAADFYQDGFGKALPLTMKDALRLEFHLAGAAELWIDDIQTIPPCHL